MSITKVFYPETAKYFSVSPFTIEEEIYSKFKTRKTIKYCILSIIIFLILIWGMVFLVWLKGYRNFNYIVPTMKETIINEREVRYEEN